MRIRVATYNIHKCKGRDGITETGRIISVLSELDADIIALQEVASSTQPACEGPLDMLTYLACQTGMDPIEGYTLSVEGNQYGNALLTRLPISALRRFDISADGREPRGVIQAAVEINSAKIILWATHLGLGIRERQQQIQELLNIIEKTDAEISLLLGDFNEWLPWARPLRALHRVFSATPSPASFPSSRPFLRLDRIWVRPADRLEKIFAHRTQMSGVASDHVPVVADIIV